jgi:hypothetical protein
VHKDAEAEYVSLMKTVLIILVVVMMCATLGVLLAGLIGLARGGGDPRRSNVLMRWRVILQAGTLVLFVILLSLLKH